MITLFKLIFWHVGHLTKQLKRMEQRIIFAIENQELSSDDRNALDNVLATSGRIAKQIKDLNESQN